MLAGTFGRNVRPAEAATAFGRMLQAHPEAIESEEALFMEGRSHESAGVVEKAGASWKKEEPRATTRGCAPAPARSTSWRGRMLVSADARSLVAPCKHTSLSTTCTAAPPRALSVTWCYG